MGYPKFVGRGKVVRPASNVDEGSMIVDTASPAAPLQPIKEVGQGTTPQEDQPSVPMDSDVQEVHSPAVRDTRGAKRSRIGQTSSSPPDNYTPPVATESSSSAVLPQHEAQPQVSSAVSASPSTTSVSSGPAPRITSHTMSTHVLPHPAALAPVGGVAPSQNAARDGTSEEWVPLRIGHDKLAEASIDDRADTAIVVKFATDSRLPSPLLISPIYRSSADSLDAAKLRTAASLLGHPNGFGLVAPILPKCLLATSRASSEKGATPDQQKWLDIAHTQSNIHRALVTRHADDSDDQALADSLQAVLQHLSALTAATGSQLWPTNELTTTWSELFTAPTRITSFPGSPTDKRTRGRQKMQATCDHTVELHCPTPLVSFIVACVIKMYGRLKHVSEEVTKSVLAMLGDNATAGIASLTDSSDDSEDADGFSRQRQRRSIQRRSGKRREAGLGRKLDGYINGLAVTAAVPSDGDCIAGLAFYKAFTYDPLRSLCTSVSVRPLYVPYVSFIIDDLASLGCNVYDDLNQDEHYARLVRSVSDLCDGHAHWSVQRRVGGGAAILWTREQYIDRVAQLNEHLRNTDGFPLAALHIRHTVAPRYRRGQVDRKRARTVSLTVRAFVPTVITSRTVRPNSVTIVTSSTGLSAPVEVLASPYATCVMEGLKRSAAATQNASADHRPYKGRRVDTTSSAVATGSNAIPLGYRAPSRALPTDQTGRASGGSSQLHASRQPAFVSLVAHRRRETRQATVR